ncbi:glutamate racemase [Marinomonas alcarazii]|uniref:Glutamate racemase n=1 Tax=Marinomonas alcarazii TaxID=491949 RepID=A0A318VBD3_9GAMM|nr:glutamate racemase [Marinomonas alcarazii]PYF84778.1 glutamate racemase [Marinomonas alcarazii]
MKIGVMDSGAGGLTILNAIHQKHPSLDLVYLADDAFAPYGSKNIDQLQDRLVKVGRFFEDENVCAIVVACNTATVAAIDTLRASTSLPVIGVEPAVKPAFRLSKKRRVAVLATPVTAKSPRLNQLIDLWKADSHVDIMSSSSLAFDIDAWPETEEKVKATIHALSEDMLAENIDTLVLACTHYPLVKGLFEKALGSQCEIIEPSEGVTAQVVRRLLESYPMEAQRALVTSSSNKGRIELCCTKETKSFKRLTQWIEDADAITLKRVVKL